LNHERWLVSYADFITLLFAFFVVMFASSQVDKKKIALLSATFDSYVSGQGPPRGAAALGPSGADAYTGSGSIGAQGPTMAQLLPAKERLEEVLISEMLAGKIELSLQPRGLVLSLKESAFFPPGQDTLSPEAYPILEKVAAALGQIPGQIRLEGHTDNTPIRNRRFPSNWRLSISRSITVLKLLANRYGLPAERLAAAGYGEYHPIASNLTEKGRAQNRRVDLVILTQTAEAFTPYLTSAGRTNLRPWRSSA
jgi:chemotaxis protein MotB